MKSRPRVGIVTTHPIQYYAPLFRRLSERGVLHPHVFYGWKGLVSGGRDPGFQRDIAWDVPLLEGYEHTFVPNESKRPGSDHRRGIVSSRLVPSLREAKIDALVVVGWNYQSHLAAMRAFHGRIPILFRGDSTLVDETRGPRQLLRRAALRWVYRHVDVGLYAGANNREYFEAHGLTADRLAWVPHTVDNQRFADPTGAFEQEARAWRRTLGIPDGATAVLFAGKLESKKAPDLLLRVFDNRDLTRVHLIFAGSGPLEAELRAKAAGRANVHFIGFQNQSRMPIVYRLGDVFVLPSRGPGETWGLAVNEAMACARPVIVSDRVGCAPDLVQPGRTGFVFRSGDTAALTSAIDSATSTSASSRMGRESERLISGWSMDVAAESIEHTVARVIQ
jgi:glycosyltransferase involved in cell wall biosynthesis